MKPRTGSGSDTQGSRCNPQADLGLHGPASPRLTRPLTRVKHHMKSIFRSRGLATLVLTCSLLGALVLGGDPIARAQNAPASAQATASKWSLDVWQTAMHGDQAGLDRLLQTIPADGPAADGTGRFRQSFEQHQSNTEKAHTKRDESREKALREMHEHIAAADLPKALRSAVTIQTLSDNLDDALNDPDILKIINWAKQQIPQVEEKLDWLQAQELLYYLRTLYEDTGRKDDYLDYNK